MYLIFHFSSLLVEYKLSELWVPPVSDGSLLIYWQAG